LELTDYRQVEFTFWRAKTPKAPKAKSAKMPKAPKHQNAKSA
jgi:hypothetical protein